MFKIALIILCASVILMAGAFAFTQPHPEKEESPAETRRPDERRRQPREEGDEVVRVRNVPINLSKLPANIRAKVNALLLKLTASQEMLAAAEREEDLAKSAVIEARAGADTVSLDLQQATDEMRLAEAQYAGEQAAYDASQSAIQNQIAHGIDMGGGQAPYPNRAALMAPRLRLKNATQRYQVSMSQISRGVNNAELRLKNVAAQIATARADLVQTESLILDLVNSN